MYFPLSNSDVFAINTHTQWHNSKYLTVLNDWMAAKVSREAEEIKLRATVKFCNLIDKVKALIESGVNANATGTVRGVLCCVGCVCCVVLCVCVCVCVCVSVRVCVLCVYGVFLI